MIARVNKPKMLTKHICKCECKFDGRKCNSNQKWNNDKCRCGVKIRKIIVYGKNCIWNPATCNCKYGKYVGSIIVNSAVICDEIIKETKANST